MKNAQQAVAIVTGAARGIGKAIAIKLAEQGAKIIAIDNNVLEGERTAGMMRTAGLNIVFRQADVGVPEDIRNVIDWVHHEVGQLDWVVNNAGIAIMTPLDDITIQEFARIMEVNLHAAFVFAKYSAPLLRKSTKASIVNIASTRALMSEPGNEAYAASKAGLIGLTHALANSLGPLVRVNAICPGWIDVQENTEVLRPLDHAQHLVGRVGRPEDIANITAFLLSEEASFITGQAYTVDGGMTKKMIYVD